MLRLVENTLKTRKTSKMLRLSYKDKRRFSDEHRMRCRNYIDRRLSISTELERWKDVRASETFNGPCRVGNAGLSRFPTKNKIVVVLPTEFIIMRRREVESYLKVEEETSKLYLE